MVMLFEQCIVIGMEQRLNSVTLQTIDSLPSADNGTATEILFDAVAFGEKRIDAIEGGLHKNTL